MLDTQVHCSALLLTQKDLQQSNLAPVECRDLSSFPWKARTGNFPLPTLIMLCSRQVNREPFGRAGYWQFKAD